MNLWWHRCPQWCNTTLPCLVQILWIQDKTGIVDAYQSLALFMLACTRCVDCSNRHVNKKFWIGYSSDIDISDVYEAGAELQFVYSTFHRHSTRYRAVSKIIRRKFLEFTNRPGMINKENKQISRADPYMKDVFRFEIQRDPSSLTYINFDQVAGWAFWNASKHKMVDAFRPEYSQLCWICRCFSYGAVHNSEDICLVCYTTHDTITGMSVSMPDGIPTWKTTSNPSHTSAGSRTRLGNRHTRISEHVWYMLCL